MDRIAALQAYTRVVELGSFSAAARDLRLRQPTVSKWIAKLEDELAVQLLDRTTRTLSVTDAGRDFYDNALEVLAAWDGALAEARSDRGALTGRLRVSVPVVFGQRCLSPLWSVWLARHPGLEMEVSYSDRYVNLVEERVDVAVRVGLPSDSSFRARLLARSTRHLVASPSYLGERGTPSDPSDLESHECLRHGGLDTRATWVFERDGRSQRVDVTGRFVANNSAALLQLAEAGHGLALLADWLVGGGLREGRLVSVLAEYELPPAPIRAIIASTRYVHPRVRLFVDFLREHLTAQLAPSLAPLGGDVENEYARGS